jgi:hypothetical protein
LEDFDGLFWVWHMSHVGDLFDTLKNYRNWKTMMLADVVGPNGMDALVYVVAFLEVLSGKGIDFPERHHLRYVTEQTVEVKSQQIRREEEGFVLLQCWVSIKVATNTLAEPHPDRVTQALMMPGLGSVDVGVYVVECVPHVLLHHRSIGIGLWEVVRKLKLLQDVLVPTPVDTCQLPGFGGARLLCESYAALSSGLRERFAQSHIQRLQLILVRVQVRNPAPQI